MSEKRAIGRTGGAVPLEVDHRVGDAPDRRAVIKLAAAALAGAGLSLLRPTTAFATTGAMQYGADNDAGANATWLSSMSEDFTLSLSNYTVSGIGLIVSARGANGIGILASGKRAPIRLAPSETAGPPAHTIWHSFGEVYVDSDGVFYRPMAEGSSPADWAPLRSTVLLKTPIRVVDTRSGIGGVLGPMRSLTTYTFGPFAGVPIQAVGLVGNLTMVASGGAMLDGRGWMAILPATSNTGTPAADPGVSSVNAGHGTYATANQFTASLGTDGFAGKVSILLQSRQALHAVIDIAGYIV